MAADILSELGLAVSQLGDIGANVRSRVLHFLLRWEHLDSLHACLDTLMAARPRLVSLHDLRAQAFLAQGRPQEALKVMTARLQIRDSMNARSLVARIHLSRDDVARAHEFARELVQEYPSSVTVWHVLGDVERARGNSAAAKAAYRQMQQLSPSSRAYLLAMVGLYQDRGDWISASGYAVSLLQTESETFLLPVSYLRELRRYFESSGEVTRADEVTDKLVRRQEQEWNESRAAIAEALPKVRHPMPAPKTTQAEPTRDTAASLPSYEDIPISDTERARILEVARELYGFETLLPGQLPCIACVLRGEDVLTILPTGGGKSLCYQLPAMLADRGTTLVVSPLIALMKDQVDSLPPRIRHRATAINSSLDGAELSRRLNRVGRGGYSLVYVAPERLRQPPFLHALRRAGVNRLVIDEAHCVSMWGHDFRPDYLYIPRARDELGNPPLLALTATAPPRVRRDIVSHLGNLRIIAGDVTRPNLQLEVFHARSLDDKLGHLLSFCQAVQGSGIVYADTRARCEELSTLLRTHGLSAAHYHAGIPDRATVQDDFMTGRTRIVVATIAFGLGIDKPDIRFIVHFYPPNSLEAYYQQAGRAGRDGLPARCLLMYAAGDKSTLTRRARRGAISIDFLRAVYRTVKRKLEPRTSGTMPAADLARELQVDETRLRVGLRLLEEADLLRRGPDMPRAAIVCLHPTDRTTPDDLRAFRDAAYLVPGQPLDLSPAKIAYHVGLSVPILEKRLLEWMDAGWLDYRPAGRDLYLELPPPPLDAADRIAALLERYDAIQTQRVDEIAAFARTGKCRHGHINAYLGGRPIDRCMACDNCIEIPPPPDAGLPAEREQLHTILRCVAEAPWSWGRVTLTRILHGSDGPYERRPPLRVEARSSACFGALSFRSEKAVASMVEQLEDAGVLQARRLNNQGVVLDLSAQGRTALDDPTLLDGL